MLRISARQIRKEDESAVARLMARGFPERSHAFWLEILAALSQRPVPPGLPRYGYLLENEGDIVGAILLIFSVTPSAGQNAIRCNVSSWYVEPAFRGYASLLVCKALSRKDVTYINITPAPNTVLTLIAQGYTQYSRGIFVAVPSLRRRGPATHISIVEPDTPTPNWGDATEHDLLRQHARYGCLSLWCRTLDRELPFVFRLRCLKRIIPCAQLIYSQAEGDFVQMAGSIGRFLAARGRPFIWLDANGAIPGLTGKYFDAQQPKYFKGPNRPRLGDLVHSETAMFGI